MKDITVLVQVYNDLDRWMLIKGLAQLRLIGIRWIFWRFFTNQIPLKLPSPIFVSFGITPIIPLKVRNFEQLIHHSFIFVNFLLVLKEMFLQIDIFHVLEYRLRLNDYLIANLVLASQIEEVCNTTLGIYADEILDLFILAI